MNFPGTNELKLTDAAMQAAVEGALNASRRDGEDYIRVTSISRTYSYGDFVVSITTDAAKPEAVELREVA